MPLWFWQMIIMIEKKKNPNGGRLPPPRSCGSTSEILGFNFKEKSSARSASPSAREMGYFSPPRRSIWQPEQTAFNLPLFHVGRDADKISVSTSQRTVSVCPSVCVSVSLFRGLFLSVSLPPKLVSQLLLTPRDKAVPVVTSADTTQGTHARAFACVRLARAPLTYLLGGRWR